MILFALEVINCCKSDLLMLDNLIHTAVGKIFKTYDNIICTIRVNCGLDTVGAMVSRRHANFQKRFAMKCFSFASVIINSNCTVEDRLDQLHAVC